MCCLVGPAGRQIVAQFQRSFGGRQERELAASHGVHSRWLRRLARFLCRISLRSHPDVHLAQEILKTARLLVLSRFDFAKSVLTSVEIPISQFHLQKMHPRPALDQHISYTLSPEIDTESQS